MPVIKSAKKKLRKDKKRTQQNSNMKEALRSLLKKFKKNPSETILRQVTQITDKAAKRHVLHKNKASRLKSALAKKVKTAPKKKA